MIGSNLPYRGETREEANRVFASIPDLKWELRPASYGRIGINSMFNRGAEWWLIGTLGIVIARVPAQVQTSFDGVNIRSKILEA